MTNSAAGVIKTRAADVPGNAVLSEGPAPCRPAPRPAHARRERAGVGWAGRGAARLLLATSHRPGFRAGSPWRLDAAGSCCSTGSASRRCACRWAASARPAGAAGSGEGRGAAGGVRPAGVRERGAPPEGCPALLPSFARCVPRSRSGASLAAPPRVGRGLEGRRAEGSSNWQRGAPQVPRAEELLGEAAPPSVQPGTGPRGRRGRAESRDPGQRLAEPPVPRGPDPAPQSCVLRPRPGAPFPFVMTRSLRAVASAPQNGVLVVSRPRRARGGRGAPRRPRRAGEWVRERPLLAGAPRSLFEAASLGRLTPSPLSLFEGRGRWRSCLRRCFWGTPERKGGPLPRRARAGNLEEGGRGAGGRRCFPERPSASTPRARRARPLGSSRVPPGPLLQPLPFTASCP